MLCESRHVPENAEDLIDFRVAREEGRTHRHLGKDAAHRPHVDRRIVVARAQQDLGRAVPERDDFVRIGAQRNTKGTRQTKVGELQVALLVNEQVLRLEVAVQNAVGMAEADATDELGCEFLHQLVHVP